MQTSIKRPELKLHWEANFKDGSVIKQFENGKERLFREVQANFPNLVYFSLVHKDKPLKISVNLVNGIIFFNDEVHAIEDVLTIEKTDVRLIYFRRNRVRFDRNLVQKEHAIIYFLGYQYLDTSGRNKKVILQITQEGKIVIGG